MKSEIQAFTIYKVMKMRKEKGFSQKELACQMNVTHSFIQQIENPRSNTAYNLNHLNLIACILKCSIKDFMPEKPFNTLLKGQNE